MLNRTMQVEIIVFKIIDKEILFLLLKRTEPRGGFWQPITGGVHEGEGLIQAANRELQEETGISQYLRIIDKVHYFEFELKDYGRLKEYVFGVEVASDVNVNLSPEHTDMKWCSLDEAMSLLKYESNKTGFKKLYSLLTAGK